MVIGILLLATDLVAYDHTELAGVMVFAFEGGLFSEYGM